MPGGIQIMSYGYDDRGSQHHPPPDQYGRPQQPGGYPPDDQYGQQDPRYGYPPPDHGQYVRQQPPGPPWPPEKKGLSRNAKIGIGAGAFLLLAVIGLATGGGSGGSTASPATTTAAANAPAVAPTTAPAAAPVPAPLTSAPTPAAAVTPVAERKAVPNVVGMDHQAAQDALQAAGFYLLAEEDSTGQGRLLLWDRNWLVVSQDPVAGTVIGTDQQVLLRSKKDTDP